MGKAKLRGSFDTRQIEGIIKQKLKNERIEKENIKRKVAIGKREEEKLAFMYTLERRRYEYNKGIVLSLYTSLEMYRQ